MADDRMLTVEEAAERIRTTPHTVRRWLRDGKLRGTRPGGTRLGWRIPESEVQKLLAGGSALTPEPRGPQGGEMTGTERGREG